MTEPTRYQDANDGTAAVHSTAANAIAPYRLMASSFPYKFLALQGLNGCITAVFRPWNRPCSDFRESLPRRNFAPVTRGRFLTRFRVQLYCLGLCPDVQLPH